MIKIICDKCGKEGLGSFDVVSLKFGNKDRDDNDRLIHLCPSCKMRLINWTKTPDPQEG